MTTILVRCKNKARILYFIIYENCADQITLNFGEGSYRDFAALNPYCMLYNKNMFKPTLNCLSGMRESTTMKSENPLVIVLVNTWASLLMEWISVCIILLNLAFLVFIILHHFQLPRVHVHVVSTLHDVRYVWSFICSSLSFWKCQSANHITMSVFASHVKLFCNIIHSNLQCYVFFFFSAKTNVPHIVGRAAKVC